MANVPNGAHAPHSQSLAVQDGGVHLHVARSIGNRPTSCIVIWKVFQEAHRHLRSIQGSAILCEDCRCHLGCPTTALCKLFAVFQGDRARATMDDYRPVAIML